MRKTAERINEIFDRSAFGISALGYALIEIAQAIDELDEKQNSQKPASESLDGKKAKALMVMIEKIIAGYKNFQHEEIFKFFEKAKAISRAENEADFQSAIADL